MGEIRDGGGRRTRLAARVVTDAGPARCGLEEITSGRRRTRMMETRCDAEGKKKKRRIYDGRTNVYNALPACVPFLSCTSINTSPGGRLTTGPGKTTRWEICGAARGNCREDEQGRRRGGAAAPRRTSRGVKVMKNSVNGRRKCWLGPGVAAGLWLADDFYCVLGGEGHGEMLCTDI